MTRALKATADRIVAALLLLLLSPLLLAIVLWIWLDDGRPAVLSQERAGKGGVLRLHRLTRASAMSAHVG